METYLKIGLTLSLIGAIVSLCLEYQEAAINCFVGYTCFSIGLILIKEVI